ncbi:DNA-protecting protein DprA [Massilia psychrophila]|uniref:DNA-protecting protein DprA n=2 Tax=Massilia psychrophila TaxID=1603353 RepID=A0A2G8T283_9BURK|nr:DNA-protecting protein DprA [Massilia psychrophila]
MAEFGSPQRVFNAGYRALSIHVPAPLARALCEPPSCAIERQIGLSLAWLERPGNHLLTLHDSAYPAALAQIPDPPPLLYVKGRPQLLAAPMLAIVGSRNATMQGKANAEVFAHALSCAGLTIVSGLALGIDAAAHQGALDGSGATVAVIGTGADIVYPARNRALAHRIAEQACIVSEYALGTPPLSHNFPRRNRIISGLSAGVLVIEAAAQSGSLITAQLAASQGRDVFAIPGSIHSALAKGCHKLIKEGAKLVESAADVLGELRMSPLVAMAKAAYANPVVAAAISGAGQALLAAMAHEPVGADALARLYEAEPKAEPGQLSLVLLELELSGQVERLPGGLFQRMNR